jgi:hypothetical protein
MHTCLNCSNQFNGNFCGECGQKAAVHRFTIHEWLHEIPHSILHIDGGFFHTFKHLCRRPGNMIREYLGGRRKSYFSPFLYVLIWCGIFIVITGLFAKPAIESPEIKGLLSAYNYLQTKYYKPFIIAMILPMSLASLLVFWRSGYYFAEHLVLNTFIIAQMIIGDIIIFLITASPYAEQSKPLLPILDFFLKYPFWIWAYWQFFKPANRLLGALQIFAAIILGGLFTSVMSLGIAYLFLLAKTGGR